MAGINTHAPRESRAKTYAMMEKTMESTWIPELFPYVSPRLFFIILRV